MFNGPRPGVLELSNLPKICESSSNILHKDTDSLLSLKALVGLLSIVQPSGVMDGDLVALCRRVRAVATGDNLSLDTHFLLILADVVKQ